MNHLERRQFLAGLTGWVAAMALDPERALWVPGKKLISIPPAIPKDLGLVCPHAVGEPGVEGPAGQWELLVWDSKRACWNVLGFGKEMGPVSQYVVDDRFGMRFKLCYQGQETL